ncbi:MULTISPECIES: AraC family transcriptional regulator [Paraliobacillus]|uniref:AraC family transcriptional regulator n=1 Tax=Paraliobacillus TaxID=200903 RepID=UPI000DD375E0|nr:MULTISPECIES: AraC family transcriptional regulator [Paraliobacillus]
MNKVENDQSIFYQAMYEILNVECLDCKPGWQFEEKTIDHHTIFFIVKGKGEIVINKQLMTMSQKNIFILLPGMKVEAYNTNESSLELYRLSFEIFRISEKTNQYRVYEKDTTFPKEGQIPLELHGSLIRLMELLIESWHSTIKSQQFKGQIYLREIINEILNNDFLMTNESTTRSFEQSIKHIQNMYHSELRLDKLSRLAGMHSTYFSSQFKKKIGKGPIEYITDLRMNRAKELMLFSNDKIRDIARMVGYNDEFYFSRRFKAKQGMAPTVYIKNIRRNIVPLSYAYTDHLVTLGVVPHAAHIAKEFTYITKQVSIPFERSQSWGFQRQALMEVKPDFVVCKENIAAKVRENLADIAPIIVIPWIRMDIFDHLKQIAQLVNKEKEAEEWIYSYEQKVKIARKKVETVIGGATVAICSITDNGFRMYGNRNMGHVYYRSLQLQPPEKLRKELEKYPVGTGINWLPVAAENVMDYEADYLLITAKSKVHARNKLKQLQAYQSWQRHPAVKAKRIYYLNTYQWIVYAPYSVERQLEEAVSLFTESKKVSALI